jgi:hypothetical protein
MRGSDGRAIGSGHNRSNRRRVNPIRTVKPRQRPGPQGVFQDGDAFSHQRVGDAQFERGGDETLLAHHGAEQAQVFEQRRCGFTVGMHRDP